MEIAVSYMRTGRPCALSACELPPSARRTNTNFNEEGEGVPRSEKVRRTGQSPGPFRCGPRLMTFRKTRSTRQIMPTMTRFLLRFDRNLSLSLDDLPLYQTSVDARMPEAQLHPVRLVRVMVSLLVAFLTSVLTISLIELQIIRLY